MDTSELFLMTHLNKDRTAVTWLYFRLIYKIYKNVNFDSTENFLANVKIIRFWTKSKFIRTLKV